jgi:hypothetical protein
LQSCNEMANGRLNQCDPSASKSQSSRVRGGSVTLQIGVVIGEPCGIEIFDLIMENTPPFVDKVGVSFEMKLNAIDGTANTKCLVSGHGA